MVGMQQDNNLELSVDIKRPLVIRAFRRSNIRKKIAEYLFEISPSSSYTSEIAYSVKTTLTNVIGAMRGMESRYKEDESLLGLGLGAAARRRRAVQLYRRDRHPARRARADRAQRGIGNRGPPEVGVHRQRLL